MKESQATDLMAALLDAFPHREARPGTARVYIRFMRDLDYDRTREAVGHLIASSEFFPSIASIRRRVHDLESGDPTPEGAWGAASAAVSEHPIIDSVIVDDENLPPRVRETLAAFNPRDILRGDAAARAHFMRLYEDATRRSYDDATTKFLGGKRSGSATLADGLPDLLEGGPDD